MKNFPTISMSVWLLACTQLQAQNLDKVLPDPVPRLVEPVEAEPPRRITQEELDGMGVKLWASPDEDVLLPELKGVRMVGRVKDVDISKLSTDDPLVCEVGSPVVQATLMTLMSAYIDKPASEESVERMVVAARLVLAQLGYPFSLVYLPPQDVTDGFIHLVVVESKIGELRVEGNKYFSDGSYLSRIPLESGEVLNADAVRTGIDRINLNPFRQSATSFVKGAEPATVDLVIKANDRIPLRAFGGYNNTGSTTTTEDRLFAGINWGNAFGWADQLTLQWTSDVEAKYSRALSTNYTADLARNHSFTFFGAYSEIRSKTDPDFDQQGESWQVGLNYDIPLSSASENLTHSLQFGFDFKSSDNNLDFIIPPFVTPIVDNVTQIVQARLQYRGQLTDRLGGTGWAIKLTAAPGDVTSRNTDEAFEQSRAFATADYVYGNLNLNRSTRLPGGWSWSIRSELQLSSANLLGSEAFSGGGSNSVRGYEEGEVIGDNAIFFSQEIALPLLSPAQGLGEGGLRDSLRLFAFQDYAHVWNVEPLPEEDPYDLLSVGLGFQYQFGAHANLSMAYGWQLKETGVSSTGDDGRLNFSFMLSY